MKKGKIGNLSPRFTFILNPYKDFRLSKCPLCHRPTHMRKFALLIHIEEWGLLAFGKTCRYCSPCELIIAHQDELEGELVRLFETHAPEVIGNPYLMLGTVENKRWKESLSRGGDELKQTLEHVSEFKKILDLKIEGGGWAPESLKSESKRRKKSVK
jgi:hypothetical protein